MFVYPVYTAKKVRIYEGSDWSHSWSGQGANRWMTSSPSKQARDQRDRDDEKEREREKIEKDKELPSWMFRREVFVFDYGYVCELGVMKVLLCFGISRWRRRLGISKAWLGFRWVLWVMIMSKSRIFTSSNVIVSECYERYDLEGPFQPRIFNDMITLKSGNQLIKLTISHAVAQSTKLLRFENMIEDTIEGAIPLPKMVTMIFE